MDFMPGIALARAYFFDLVEHALWERYRGGLRYGAALIGYGSEGLGYDTPMSTDHKWGPRLLLFVRPEDIGRRDEIMDSLGILIPDRFRDWPTRLALHDANAPDADEHGYRPPQLRIEVHEMRAWILGW